MDDLAGGGQEGVDDGITRTNPGYASIVTGTRQRIKNDGTDQPTKPTIYEYFRKQKNVPEDKVAVVIVKDMLNVLAYSAHPDHGKAFGASVTDASQPPDNQEARENIRKVVSASHPRLIVVNLPETDSAGHSP